ncbi:MAG: tetratricopeptide repeat protein [Desulfatibacillaceae bacterium]
MSERLHSLRILCAALAVIAALFVTSLHAQARQEGVEIEVPEEIDAATGQDAGEEPPGLLLVPRRPPPALNVAPPETVFPTEPASLASPYQETIRTYRENPERAMEIADMLEQELSRNPGNYQAHKILGVLYYATGDYGKAEQHLDRIDPMDFMDQGIGTALDLILIKADAMHRLGRSREAEAYLAGFEPYFQGSEALADRYKSVIRPIKATLAGREAKAGPPDQSIRDRRRAAAGLAMGFLKKIVGVPGRGFLVIVVDEHNMPFMRYDRDVAPYLWPVEPDRQPTLVHVVQTGNQPAEWYCVYVKDGGIAGYVKRPMERFVPETLFFGGDDRTPVQVARSVARDLGMDPADREASLFTRSTPSSLEPGVQPFSPDIAITERWATVTLVPKGNAGAALNVFIEPGEAGVMGWILPEGMDFADRASFLGWEEKQIMSDSGRPVEIYRTTVGE